MVNELMEVAIYLFAIPLLVFFMIHFPSDLTRLPKTEMVKFTEFYALLAILVASYCSIEVGKTVNLELHGVKTQGRVTGDIRLTPEAPISSVSITFTTQKGAVIQPKERYSVLGLGNFFFGPPKKGTKVAIIYDPVNPEEYRIERPYLILPMLALAFSILVLAYMGASSKGILW